MDNFNQLTAPGYPIFLGSEFEHPPIDKARFHILPVPYEATVSYQGGTGLGPAKILEASWQLETWDGYSTPCEQGIFTHPPVNVKGKGAKVIKNIAKDIKKIVKMGGFPIALGGEHSITYGVVKGLMDAGIKDIGVIQIDAHADLRDAYLGDKYSHASVMKRVVDEGIPVFQLGVRALCHEEVAARKKYGVYHLDATELVPNNVTSIDLPKDFPKNIFVTLDIDGLDPAIFPSTGTPVPGGLGWYQTLALFESVVKQRNIVGFDVMEFAPIKGFHAYEFSAAMLVYNMMGIVERCGLTI